MDRFAVDQDLAADAAQHSEQRQQQFALALAVEPAEPDHFAPANAEGDIPETRRPGQIARLDHGHLGRRLHGGLGRKYVIVFAADHHFDHFIVGLGAGLVGRDLAAIAEHRAIVGQFGDLMHAMRDVEQRNALCLQPPQHLENALHVRGRQRRGGFVENQKARLARQRLGDFDDLPPRQRQILDLRHRMNVLAAGARQCGLGQSALRLAIDQAEAAGRIRDDNVIRDGEIGDQRQFLEDADDARRIGRGGIGKDYLASLQQHAPLVGGDHAGHDLDQGRLAGAVFTEDGVHAPGLHVQIGILKGEHTTIALGNAFHAEQRRILIFHFGRP